VAGLAGAVAGPALQLQQAALWPAAAYALLAAAGLLAAWSALRMRSLRRQRPWLLFASLALVAGAATGLRAVAFVSQALDPALEGRDIVVTGIVATMPQRNEAGQRFRLQVEEARVGGERAVLPPKLLLGWYGGAEPAGDGRIELQARPPELRPGERWRWTVRLKAPHGHVNPHGFDYELWLWELRRLTGRGTLPPTQSGRVRRPKHGRERQMGTVLG
jgi:competence protein ComEC